MTTATKERIINKVENLSESDALMVLNFIDDIKGHVPTTRKIDDPFYSQKNQEYLGKAIADLEAGRGLVHKTMEELRAMENE